ncbi:mannitol dehydrogenase family protein [Granulicella sp. S190]|uniref:mannitol dehydrogenase family protein n=1 Tax=Granulicella sp. S190 TaxID=1747226 RepID=UPI00131BA942|nr:mannitol dehydrogenase family protein [Granulicella sp. S190]
MSTRHAGIRLSDSTVAQLDKKIQRPSYDRTKLRPHTVHMGVGGFHRAHQAVYLDNLLERGTLTDWGECGMGVLTHDVAMRDALREQNYLYTVLERSAKVEAARIVGSIIDFCFAPENPEAAIERLAHEDTRLVSLTITEGGYFLHEGTGEFVHDDPSIQHDVRKPSAPITSLGLLTAALMRRRDRGLAPFTVMSCDNLQGNGHVIRRVLLGLAELQDLTLHRWIADNVAFPNSMVDRITPATTASDREQLLKNFSIHDAWPVVTEPFLQWVIEDTFCNARPPWEEVGAEIVVDVLPYELMKIRLLNASHMAMAYLGALAGHTFAHEVMQDPVFDAFIKSFMEEVTPVVPLIPGTSIPSYKSTLIERFANPTINDRVARLCSEGSAKMPKWVLPSVVELAEKHNPTKLLSLVIAAWIKYLQSSSDECGNPIEVVDVRADDLKRVTGSIGDDPRPFIALKSLFGHPYFAEPVFANDVEAALKLLSTIGTRATIRRFIAATN